MAVAPSLMTRRIQLTHHAVADYRYWEKHDKKILKRIRALIENIAQTPFSGLGKPEPLKENLAGLWSRRIDQKHRLVYEVLHDQIIIQALRFHYNDK
jgi:toxin YoeB